LEGEVGSKSQNVILKGDRFAFEQFKQKRRTVKQKERGRGEQPPKEKRVPPSSPVP